MVIEKESIPYQGTGMQEEHVPEIVRNTKRKTSSV
jgi:hypothetical protein